MKRHKITVINLTQLLWLKISFQQQEQQQEQNYEETNSSSFTYKKTIDDVELEISAYNDQIFELKKYLYFNKQY